MKEIAISKFKATCLAVVEEVRKTGAPVRITKFGKPVAEIVPTRPAKKKSWLGCMRDSTEILGDIAGPISSVGEWTVDE
jgi:prevent-host-death family protein